MAATFYCLSCLTARRGHAYLMRETNRDLLCPSCVEDFFYICEHAERRASMQTSNTRRPANAAFLLQDGIPALYEGSGIDAL